MMWAGWTVWRHCSLILKIFECRYKQEIVRGTLLVYLFDSTRLFINEGAI